MICSNCNCDIVINSQKNEKNNGILRNNIYYCIACDEALIFMNDINKEKPKIKENKINISHTYTCCYKCNNPYENNRCNNCNIINPLSIRKK